MDILFSKSTELVNRIVAIYNTLQPFCYWADKFTQLTKTAG